MLCVDRNYIYYINNEQTGVVRVHTGTFDRLAIPLADDKIYQLSVVEGRIYAISENGNIQVCFKKSSNKFLDSKPKKAAALEDSEPIEESAEVNDAFEYETKLVKMSPVLMSEEVADANNLSVYSGGGSDKEQHLEDDKHFKDDEIKHTGRSDHHSTASSATSKGLFYRTLEADHEYVVSVAHDATGMNHIYLYDNSLNLLADKKIQIKKVDFSFNTCKIRRSNPYRCLPA